MRNAAAAGTLTLSTLTATKSAGHLPRHRSVRNRAGKVWLPIVADAEVSAEQGHSLIAVLLWSTSGIVHAVLVMCHTVNHCPETVGGFYSPPREPVQPDARAAPQQRYVARRQRPAAAYFSMMSLLTLLM